MPSKSKTESTLASAGPASSMSGFTGGPYQVGRFHSVVTGACLPGFRLTVQPGRCGSASALFCVRATVHAFMAIRVYYP